LSSEEKLLRVGAFELVDPVPICHEPYALAILKPWIDVNNVGTMVLKEIENRFGAKALGRLAKPGNFYDFTRYRPIIHIEQGIQNMTVPNTKVHYAKRDGENDLLLVRLLEPHSRAEHYVDSVVKLLVKLNVKKYILLGSMYDAVPHTKPLLVSGYGMGEGALEDIRKAGILPITYRGPSTMANLITKKAAEAGIQAMAFIVSLPQYVALDEDFLGKVRIMELLNMLYGIPLDREDLDRAMEQRTIVDQRVDNSVEARMLLPQLERVYDMRVQNLGDEGGTSPEIEEILWTPMGKDIGKA
jgi:predicted ATP-grasp superfamily ATP-dependent carboligase